jgi:hypothetical protein
MLTAFTIRCRRKPARVVFHHKSLKSLNI